MFFLRPVPLERHWTETEPIENVESASSDLERKVRLRRTLRSGVPGMSDSTANLLREYPALFGRFGH